MNVFSTALRPEDYFVAMPRAFSERGIHWFSTPAGAMMPDCFNGISEDDL